MSKRYKRLLSVIISIVLLAGIATAVGAVDIFSLKNSEQAAMASDSDTIILRVCNCNGINNQFRFKVLNLLQCGETIRVIDKTQLVRVDVEHGRFMLKA